jgi:pimeloyl-ACP methyl ester carboxylesterase
MAWAGAAPELARLGRFIVYDRRGCSRSERPDPYPTVAVSSHADDAASLLEALAAVPAIVIGRSYGGDVAVDLALRYPRLVRALVLLEGAPASLSPESREWEGEMTRRVLAAADQGIPAGEALIRDVLGDVVWDQLPAELRSTFSGNSPAVLAELRGGRLSIDPSMVAALDKPTLLVSATDSALGLRAANEVLAAAMPRSRLVRVEGGHLIDPAHAAVLDFIRDVLAAGQAGAPTSSDPAR